MHDQGMIHDTLEATRPVSKTRVDLVCQGRRFLASSALPMWRKSHERRWMPFVCPGPKGFQLRSEAIVSHRVIFRYWITFSERGPAFGKKLLVG